MIGRDIKIRKKEETKGNMNERDIIRSVLRMKEIKERERRK